MARMLQSVALLRLLARLDPRLEEVVHPHLPLARETVALRAGRFDQVELNPQPLPPRELVRVATLEAARAVAEAAIAAQFAGRDAREVLDQVADDWCGTSPGSIPWPRHWPHPWPPGDPYPISEEMDSVAQASQAYAALVFGAYAEGLADEGLAAAFAGMADRLERAAATVRGTG
jgi:hypothetical protein